MKNRVFILIVGLVLILASCRVNRPVVNTEQRTDSLSTVYEREWDTVVKTVPDSSLFVALLKCDSAGNAYMSEIVKLKAGRNTNQSFSLLNNVLTVDCKVDSMAVYLRLSKVYKTSSIEKVTHKIVTVQVDKPDTWFQKTLKILGWIFIGCIVLTAAWVFKELKKA